MKRDHAKTSTIYTDRAVLDAVTEVLAVEFESSALWPLQKDPSLNEARDYIRDILKHELEDPGSILAYADQQHSWKDIADKMGGARTDEQRQFYLDYLTSMQRLRDFTNRQTILPEIAKKPYEVRQSQLNALVNVEMTLEFVKAKINMEPLPENAGTEEQLNRILDRSIHGVKRYIQDTLDSDSDLVLYDL